MGFAVLILFVRGLAGWTLLSAGVSKLAGPARWNYRLLAAMEAILGGAMFLPRGSAFALIAGGLVFLSFSVFMSRRPGGVGDCGCGSALPMPSTVRAHVILTTALAGASWGAALATFVGVPSTVWAATTDVVFMITAPGFVIVTLRARETLRDMRAVIPTAEER